MTAIIPFPRVVVVVIIVVGFIAACQGEGCYADEKGQAEDVFYSVFHDAVFIVHNRKTLPGWEMVRKKDFRWG